MTLEASSIDMAIAFLAAVVMSSENKKEDYLAKAIIVEDRQSWHSLVMSSEPLILIQRNFQAEELKGQHIFIPTNIVSSSTKNRLSRINFWIVREHLQKIGFNSQDTIVLARLARKSFQAFRRRLAVIDNFETPNWSKGVDCMEILLAMMMLGAWNSNNSLDRQAIEQLTGKSISEINTALVKLENLPDPPLRKIGGIWTICDLQDCWILISRFLTDDLIDRFKQVALEILTREDDTLKLDFYERLFKPRNINSNYIISGICKILALMGSENRSIATEGNFTKKKIAEEVVVRLMGTVKTSPILWHSISFHLPLLSEAAPTTLLEAIEADLESSSPQLLSLFQDFNADGVIASGSEHPGLLWTLERLSWNSRYISRITTILVKLTNLDPGGTLVNRPWRSLITIIGRCLLDSYQLCLNVVNLVLNQDKQLGWQLILEILRGSYLYEDINDEPEFAEWGEYQRSNNISIEESIKLRREVIIVAFKNLQNQENRLQELIKIFSQLPDSLVKEMLENFMALDPKTFSDTDRGKIQFSLKRAIAEHNILETWDCPPETIARQKYILDCLIQIENRFKTEHLIYGQLWLFDSYNPDGQNYTESQINSVNNIIQELGWDGIEELAQNVSSPRSVGKVLSHIDPLPIPLGNFIRQNFWSEEEWRQELVYGYILSMAGKESQIWIENCLTDHRHEWSDSEYGQFLAILPFNDELLELVETSSDSTQSAFWQSVSRIYFDNVLHYSDFVLNNLIKYKRAIIAICPIYYNRANNASLFSPERISDIVEAA